jgi:carboxymethylenebutenolidase
MNKALTSTLFVLAFARAATAAAEVRVETTSWTNPRDGTEIPAHVFYDAAQARADGTLPAVLFIHARRGLQEADRKYVAEIAAGGFFVLAPDWQSGRFIAPWPVPHDPATELDVALGLAHLKTQARVRPNERRVLYGYSRGGYYAVRIASGALDPAHRDDVACIVTVAGHFQNPNAPEAAQVYGLMPELDRLAAPILMIIGTEDISLRVDNNARAFYALINRGHPADLVLLPQARRAFDFREYLAESTYTPAERAAKRYAMARTAQFMRGCFG